MYTFHDVVGQASCDEIFRANAKAVAMRDEKKRDKTQFSALPEKGSILCERPLCRRPNIVEQFGFRKSPAG